jgi:two-component system, cell cycle response regulator DivK
MARRLGGSYTHLSHLAPTHGSSLRPGVGDLMARVAIVASDPTNLALMEYLLRAAGHVVMVAASADRAADALQDPDLILVDLQGPNAPDAPRLFKADAALRRARIIGLAPLGPGEPQRLLERGFDGYLAKPITPETFADQVSEFLGR